MKTAVVICPGRGTYNKAELGYLSRHFPDTTLLGEFDAARSAAGQPTLTKLDTAARFSAATHTRGDNVSALIFAVSYGDFRCIDREKTEIVAVTGNSMGWYTALTCAGALSAVDGFNLANGMGTAMQKAMIGGQLIYPFQGDGWRDDPARKAELLALVADINARDSHDLALSIDLGGMLVLAGDEAGLAAFENAVPSTDRFPMRLPNHAAFHTHLQHPVAAKGRAAHLASAFQQPRLPLIDGRGGLWWPHATDTNALWDYTLGAQVTETYDFTAAITTAAQEFAPDYFIITGPGTTLGGAVIQSLILAQWRDMHNRADFETLQTEQPLVLSLGRAEQRDIVTKGQKT